LAIGAVISRRVTKSVHDMHQGILALQKGDLQAPDTRAAQ